MLRANRVSQFFVLQARLGHERWCPQGYSVFVLYRCGLGVVCHLGVMIILEQ